MNEVQSTGDLPKPLDVIKAGPLALRNSGISFAVDGSGSVLRYPDDTPIDGQQIEDMVNGSGRRLTNAQAAGQIIANQEFVDGVIARLAELRPAQPRASGPESSS